LLGTNIVRNFFIRYQVIRLNPIVLAGLRVGPVAVTLLIKEAGPRLTYSKKIRSLVVQNTNIAQISEHYQLSSRLRANNSQIISLRFSPVVQG
jgi:hypothetical protein